MVERELGEATIVYDDPDEDTVERTVKNEHIAYFQDHWTVRIGTDEDDNDTVRRIPHQRVHYVERSVEEFEEEVKTLRRQVQALADDLRSKLPVGSRGGGGSGAAGQERDPEPVHVDIEEGEPARDD